MHEKKNTIRETPVLMKNQNPELKWIDIEDSSDDQGERGHDYQRRGNGEIVHSATVAVAQLRITTPFTVMFRIMKSDYLPIVVNVYNKSAE